MMSEARALKRYTTLRQLFRQNAMVFMAEQLVRPRYPHEFPIDVIWFLDGIVVSITSLDLEEGTRAILAQSRTFGVPPSWQQFAVAVI